MSEGVIGEVQLRHIAGFHAVTLTVRGTYADRSAPWVRLTAWAQAAGVFACGSAVTVYFSAPATAGGELVRFSMCLPVSKPDAAMARAALAPGDEKGAIARRALQDGDVVEVREFPRILAAVGYYRGAAPQASAAYDAVRSWVREHPYLPTGAPREVHMAEPGVLAGDLVEIEVQQPVIPKPR